MIRKTLFLALTLPIAALLFACSTVPLTGRRQLDLVPSDQIMAMSAQQYDQVLDEHTVIRGTDDARMVDRVGNRIRSAVERYLASQKQSQLLQGYNWEFNLIKDDSANAWAMPGGKVAVYTGILPITQNENGLATVLGPIHFLSKSEKVWLPNLYRRPL